ncbi:hypothetical protein [Bdellovibrio sp. NC01]|uniref:hypothetical protein n=1 Tax=Bdellovibrio sp. NC01 TaxID=2220073 RepID=UPI001FED76DB|nr:hypothetical protein [Bdellovibrio sp. NC01]
MAQGLVFALVTVFTSLCLAASPAKIKKLVDDFDKLQTFKMIMAGQGPMPLPDDPNMPEQPTNPSNPPGPHPPQQPNCPPSTGYPKACVEAVCSHLSRFDCDEQGELAEITRNCRNVTSACVNTVCNRVSRFDCDEKTELFTVTQMCRGLMDVSCIDYVCSRLSRFDCDELSELRKIADQCR